MTDIANIENIFISDQTQARQSAYNQLVAQIINDAIRAEDTDATPADNLTT